MKPLFYYLIATIFIVSSSHLLSAKPTHNIRSINLATYQEGPAEVSNINFSGDFEDKKIIISWANPSDSDFESVELTYFYGKKKKPVIVEITEGKRSYTLKGSYEKMYKIILKTKNKKGNYSAGVTNKIYFGNFNPENMRQFKSFDGEIVAILAGKLKLKYKTNDLDRLTDMDFKTKFSNLKLIEGKVEINNIDKLTTLNAFSKVKQIGGKIYIAKNGRLNDFCGLKFSVDNDGIFPSKYKAEYNSYNPSLDDIKNEDTCKK